MKMINDKWLLLALFFMSGFIGLVYETLWQKQMITILGASAPAITAVLGAFFAGVAMGGKVGDAALSRSRISGLRLYAMTEIVIAANALAMPLIQKGLHQVYLPVAHAFGSTSTVAYGFRFGATMFAILPATVAMGATIPFMAEVLRHRSKEAVGTAYGVNALGAMIGAVAGPLSFVPAFGIRGALLVAFALNLVVVVAAVAVSFKENPREILSKQSLAGAGLSWNLAYFTAGAVALGAETTWLRILAMQTTNGTMLFSTTLAVFLGAFAIGSLLIHPYLARRVSARDEAAWIQIAVSTAILAAVPLIHRTSTLYWEWIMEPPTGVFSELRISLYEVCAVIFAVFLPALAMGIVFPAMSRVTRAAGSLYFWGNLGSLAGALVFGLALVPGLGLNGSLMLLSMVSAVIGLWLLPRDVKMRAATIVCCACAVVLWNTLPPLIKNNMTVQRHPDGSYGEYRKGQEVSRIVRYKEGQSATIIIRDSLDGNGAPQYRRVYVDDQCVASTDPDAVVDSKMLAHLPALLHPAPKRALSVGYGSGGTSWSLALHNLEARTVEIEREVLNSAELFPYGEVRNKSNFKAILNDARDHLQTTDEHYDYISTDATNVRYKQNSSLYTKEYFELMRERLTENGIACVWIPMSAISLIEFRTLLRTFQEVYPHASLWLMNEMPTYFGILIGTRAPLRVDMRRVRTAMGTPDVSADLAIIGIEHPYQIPASILLDEAGMRTFSAGAPLHTDDDPVLEENIFFGAYLPYLHSFTLNLDAALKHRPSNPGTLVAGLNAGERAEFEQVWIASKHWYEVILAEGRLRETYDPAARLALARSAISSADAAVLAHPGWRTWREGYAELERDLRESTGAKPTSPPAGYPPIH